MRRTLAGGLVALTGLLWVAAAAPATAAPAPAAEAPAAAPATGYVVRAVPGSLDAVQQRVGALGGTVTRRLAVIDGLAVRLPAAAAERLRQDPRVAEVTGDARVQLLGSTYDPSTDPGSMGSVAAVVGARGTWRTATGRGVDVALIDSGVSPVAGLDGAGKLVNGPDLSFDSQSPSTRYVDGYGHGTHMAGIIAGRDAGTDPATGATNGFLGVAPDARIVSVKVADSRGGTDVSQVIAGIDWVVQHRSDPGMNIRVLNLSFGTPSTQAYALDPLAHAAEQAWHAGIVVVVSAGNDGGSTGRLLDPASDPYVLAVGAEDPKGTQGVADDVVPEFSSRGDGVRNPDVVAPGQSVQSLRVPGSWIDTQYGASGRLDDRFFRGSGTSQAAAVVSGAVALLLQQRPELTPDQVKGLLRGTATSLRATDTPSQGRGLVKVDKAVSAGVPSGVAQTWTRSSGTGSLDAARGGRRLVLDGVVLDGERDIFGRAVDTAAHARLAESGSAWTGGSWNGSTWAGSTWAGSSWAGSTWAGSSWAGSTWAGSTWAGSTWAGSTWAGTSWAGESWS